MENLLYSSCNPFEKNKKPLSEKRTSLPLVKAVSHSVKDGKPDTYVFTGDIDAMWLRDSSAQVYPNLHFVKDDKKPQQLVAGVINHQTRCMLKDPYANAFYNDPQKVGEWAKDDTDMRPGIHERKWEIDSLCYPIRLAYRYRKLTGDVTPFNDQWKSAITLMMTFPGIVHATES